MLSAKEPEWWSKQVEALSRTKVFGNVSTLQAHLDATRKEMFDTLTMFYSQVRSIAYFATAVLGLSVATVAFAFRNSAEDLETRTKLLAIAVSLMVATVPFGWFAIRNMRERYRCYVSAVVYAAQVHAAAGILSHPWLEWISLYLKEAQPRNNQELVNYWMETPPNAFISYRRTIIVVQCLSVLGALFIFIVFIWPYLAAVKG